MEAAFEAVHGPGTCKQVNGLYSRLDALRDIGKKFSGASVLKPTPVDFLPKGVNDPRIIEGLGLRKVVSQLSEPTADYPRGAFDAAKIKPDVVLKLQELGSLLERSKVQDRSKIGFGRYSSATAGA